VKTEPVDGAQTVTDDFDQEIETLRTSPAFQRFLEERSRSRRRIPLREIEAAIDGELEAEGETP